MQLIKQLPEKKFHAGINSSLYQSALADRKLGGYYRTLGLTKTNIYVGIETNPNKHNISHTGFLLLNRLSIHFIRFLTVFDVNSIDVIFFCAPSTSWFCAPNSK